MHPRGEKHPTVGWLFWMTDLNWLRERQIFPWNEDAYFFLSGLPRWLGAHESACQCKRGGLGRSPGGGNGSSLQFSCLGNSVDRGAWCPWGCKELHTAWRLSSGSSGVRPFSLPSCSRPHRSSSDTFQYLWKRSEVSGVMELPGFLLVSFWGHMSSELKKRQGPRWASKPAHLLLTLPLAWFLAPRGKSSPSPGLSVAVAWVQGSQNLIVAFLKEQVVKLMTHGY